MSDCFIRNMQPEEYGLLKDFLYEAIFRPQRASAPPYEIVNHPALRLYHEEFGSEKQDLALCAECRAEVVGAIWCRCMNGYGHVADDIPELAMAVKAPFRGHGIGKRLLQKLLDELKGRGCREVSLSVQKINFACELYRKAGFHTVRETEEEYIMVYRF